MLALVKKPRIELSIQGENVDELIEWIRKKFEVSILTSDNAESIAIEDTDSGRRCSRIESAICSQVPD